MSTTILLDPSKRWRGDFPVQSSGNPLSPSAGEKWLSRGSRRKGSSTAASRPGIDRTASVGINTNTKARLLLRERRVVSEGRFADMVIWQLPRPVPGSGHGFKYRLAFVVDEVCVLRFGNEPGKGDQKHVGLEEVPYAFTSLAQLAADFRNEIEEWGP